MNKWSVPRPTETRYLNFDIFTRTYISKQNTVYLTDSTTKCQVQQLCRIFKITETIQNNVHL